MTVMLTLTRVIVCALIDLVDVAGLETAARTLSTTWQKLVLSLYHGRITRGCTKKDTGVAMWKGAAAVGFHEAGFNQGPYMALPFLSKEIAAVHKLVVSLPEPVRARMQSLGLDVNQARESAMLKLKSDEDDSNHLAAMARRGSQGDSNAGLDRIASEGMVGSAQVVEDARRLLQSTLMKTADWELAEARRKISQTVDRAIDSGAMVLLTLKGHALHQRVSAAMTACKGITQDSLSVSERLSSISASIDEMAKAAHDLHEEMLAEEATLLRTMMTIMTIAHDCLRVVQEQEEVVRESQTAQWVESAVNALDTITQVMEHYAELDTSEAEVQIEILLSLRVPIEKALEVIRQGEFIGTDLFNLVQDAQGLQKQLAGEEVTRAEHLTENQKLLRDALQTAFEGLHSAAKHRSEIEFHDSQRLIREELRAAYSKGHELSKSLQARSLKSRMGQVDAILGAITEVLAGTGDASDIKEAMKLAARLEGQLAKQSLTQEAAFLKDLQDTLERARAAYRSTEDVGQAMKRYQNFSEDLERRKKLSDSKSELMEIWMQQEEALRNSQTVLTVKSDMIVTLMEDPEVEAIYKVKVGLKKAAEAEAAIVAKISRSRSEMSRMAVETQYKQRALDNKQHLLVQNEARQVELDRDSEKLEVELEQGSVSKDKLVREVQKQILTDPHLNEVFKDISIKKILANKLRGSDETKKRRKLQADKKLLKMKAAAAKAESLTRLLAAKGVVSDQNMQKMEIAANRLQSGTEQARERIEKVAAEARRKVQAEAEESCMDIMSFIGLMAGGSPVTPLHRIALPY